MGIIFAIVVIAGVVGVVLYNKKKKASKPAPAPKKTSSPRGVSNSGQSTSDYYSQTR